MKKLQITLIIFGLILLCGCADYKEIDRGYIVTAVGASQQDNIIKITLETLSSSDVADKPSERLLLSGEGASIKSAIDALNSHLVKPLYFEQLGSIIFQENLHQTQKRQLLDYLINNQKINFDSHIINTPDVSALFDIDTHDGVLGYDIIGLIDNHKKQNDINIKSQIYHIIQQPNVSPPTVSVLNDSIFIETSGENND